MHPEVQTRPHPVVLLKTTAGFASIASHLMRMQARVTIHT